MLREYYKDNLNNVEKIFYNRLYTAILHNKNDVDVDSSLDNNQLKIVIMAVILDHPELIKYDAWLRKSIGFNNFIKDRKLKLDYLDISEENIDKFESIFNKLFNNLVTKIDKYVDHDDEYNIIKTIFDYFVLNYNYDFEALREFQNLQQKIHNNSSHKNTNEFLNKYRYSFSPYGILINKKGVCCGLSMLFKMVCDRINIECACVECKIDKYAHMINIVEINNKRYFLDVTNSLNTDKNMPIRYDLFLISNDKIKKFCTFEDNYDECNYDDNDYFILNNLSFDSYIKLKRYLESYSFCKVDGEIRFEYLGNDLLGDDLKKFADEILLCHLESCCILMDDVTNLDKGFFTAKLLKKGR